MHRLVRMMPDHPAVGLDISVSSPDAFRMSTERSREQSQYLHGISRIELLCSRILLIRSAIPCLQVSQYWLPSFASASTRVFFQAIDLPYFVRCKLKTYMLIVKTLSVVALCALTIVNHWSMELLSSQCAYSYGVCRDLEYTR